MCVRGREVFGQNSAGRQAQASLRGRGIGKHRKQKKGFTCAGCGLADCPASPAASCCSGPCTAAKQGSVSQPPPPNDCASGVFMLPSFPPSQHNPPSPRNGPSTLGTLGTLAVLGTPTCGTSRSSIGRMPGVTGCSGSLYSLMARAIVMRGASLHRRCGWTGAAAPGIRQCASGGACWLPPVPWGGCSGCWMLLLRHRCGWCPVGSGRSTHPSPPCPHPPGLKLHSLLLWCLPPQHPPFPALPSTHPPTPTPHHTLSSLACPTPHHIPPIHYSPAEADAD